MPTRLRNALIGLTAALTLASATSAPAAVIFQSIPSLDAAPAAFWCSSCALGVEPNTHRVFDTFTIGSATPVAQLSFVYGNWPSYPAQLGDFSVSIWSLSGGLPDTQLFSQDFTLAQATFTNTSNPDWFTGIATVNLTGLNLSAGTYDISIYSNTYGPLAAFTGGSGLLYQQGIGFHPGQSLGFTLIDTVAAVPEPSTWAMMLLGFAGIAFVAYRRKTVAVA